MTQENNKKNTAVIEKLFLYLVHLFPPSIIGWTLWPICFTLPLEYLIFPLVSIYHQNFRKKDEKAQGPRKFPLSWGETHGTKGAEPWGCPGAPLDTIL